MKRWSKFHVRQDAAGRLARTYKGIEFDSKLELSRYKELELLELAGHIVKLQRQVTWPLYGAALRTGERDIVAKYIADFVYHTYPAGELIVEDAKGVITPEYRLKKKLMRVNYGIEVREWPERRGKKKWQTRSRSTSSSRNSRKTRSSTP